MMCPLCEGLGFRFDDLGVEPCVCRNALPVAISDPDVAQVVREAHERFDPLKEHDPTRADP